MTDERGVTTGVGGHLVCDALRGHVLRGRVLPWAALPAATCHATIGDATPGPPGSVA
jgi:hypothetical protein